MRILTFGHLFPNSIQPVWGIFVYQRIAHFARRAGNVVRVVAPIPYIPRWFPSESREKYKRIPLQELVGGIPVEHPRYPLVPRIAMVLHGLLLFSGCYRRIARLYRDEPFECIDSHWIYPDGFAAVLAGKMLGVPVFCSARGTDVNVYPNMPVIRRLVRWTLRNADGIISVSQALKDVMVALGIPEEKIRVIGNGADINRFYPTAREEARKQLGLPTTGHLLAAVGSLTEHKGHSLLISAVARLLGRWPDLRLAIVGEGPLRARLERLISEEHLEGRVLLTGACLNEKLVSWYNAADLSCLPSSREGWPNVLLESLACGTPVVATRVGGVPEVITSAKLGILVEPGLEPLIAGLDDALGRAWNREVMTEYAKSRTWDKVAEEMQDFLEERCSIFASRDGARTDANRVHERF